MGSIGGHVLDPTGRPIDGATVMIGRSSTDHPDIAQLTDAQGRYRLDGLEVGEYTIVAYLANGTSVEAHVTLATETQRVTCDLGG